MCCRGVLRPLLHRLRSHKRAPEWQAILLRDAEFRILLCEFRYPSRPGSHQDAGDRSRVGTLGAIRQRISLLPAR